MSPFPADGMKYKQEEKSQTANQKNLFGANTVIEGFKCLFLFSSQLFHSSQYWQLFEESPSVFSLYISCKHSTQYTFFFLSTFQRGLPQKKYKIEKKLSVPSSPPPHQRAVRSNTNLVVVPRHKGMESSVARFSRHSREGLCFVSEHSLHTRLRSKPQH